MTDNQSIFFLHGLESSGNGTKGRFFGEHFPHIIRPDFEGGLATRINRLEGLCTGDENITLIGSSFGGLMACHFADNHRQRVSRLILMAPALNFEAYTPPSPPISIPTLLVIGTHDETTPINPVVGLAQSSFSNLTVWISDDDHMLHSSFAQLDWSTLLDLTIDLISQKPPAGFQRNYNK
ncbi:MAG: pimeloyl-ACP methyl ester carboxylesterase [Desulforhopalus sp.]|jgi:pimeloyl-ACP methyl ester carboxylesterase